LFIRRVHPLTSLELMSSPYIIIICQMHTCLWRCTNQLSGEICNPFSVQNHDQKRPTLFLIKMPMQNGVPAMTPKWTMYICSEKKHNFAKGLRVICYPSGLTVLTLSKLTNNILCYTPSCCDINSVE